MPYDTLDGLPENVTNVLPKHAQEIYRAAFTVHGMNIKTPAKGGETLHAKKPRIKSRGQR